MRGYRVKYDKRSFKVQVRFLLFWRTLAVYPIEYKHMGVARQEANAIDFYKHNNSPKQNSLHI